MLDSANLRVFLRLVSLVCLLPLLATNVFAAAPVAVNDTYVVDVGGTLTVRASFPDTVTALDPSLYWRFNDTTNNAATTVRSTVVATPFLREPIPSNVSTAKVGIPCPSFQR